MLVLSNIAVAVLPDDAMEDPGMIILGGPALRLFGQIAWLNNGKEVALGMGAYPADCSLGAGEIYDLGDGVGIIAFVEDRPAPLFFDSGSVYNYALQKERLFHPSENRYRMRKSSIRRLRVDIGGEELLLRGTPLAPKNLAFPGIVLILGENFIRRAGNILIDYDQMTISLTGERAGTEWTCPDG